MLSTRLGTDRGLPWGPGLHGGVALDQAEADRAPRASKREITSWP